MQPLPAVAVQGEAQEVGEDMSKRSLEVLVAYKAAYASTSTGWP
jgi:hypothetical protein